MNWRENKFLFKMIVIISWYSKDVHNKYILSWNNIFVYIDISSISKVTKSRINLIKIWLSMDSYQIIWQGIYMYTTKCILNGNHNRFSIIIHIITQSISASLLEYNRLWETKVLLIGSVQRNIYFPATRGCNFVHLLQCVS